MTGNENTENKKPNFMDNPEALIHAAMNMFATPPSPAANSETNTSIQLTVVINNYGSPKGWFRRMISKIF